MKYKGEAFLLFLVVVLSVALMYASWQGDHPQRTPCDCHEICNSHFHCELKECH